MLNTARTTALLLGIAMCAQLLAAPVRPNIVIVLADDLGYGSVGCYGADPKLIQTPNIDRLAKEGMRFTDANTPSSVCTPTRYGLLTGRYCWRSSLKFGVSNVKDPLLIETERATLAGLLKRQGYVSAAVGKWHLGYGSVKPVDFTAELKPGPLELGFDYHFAVPQNNGDMTGVYVENHGVVGLRSKKLLPDPGKTHYGSQYIGLDAPQRDDSRNMHVLTDKAIAWLEGVPKAKSFFLYFAATAVHEPITPSKESAYTSKAGPYGDFIHDVDRSVGRLLKAVEERGDAERTLFLFTSDNGGVIPRSTGALDRNPATRRAVQAGLEINGAWRGRKHTIWEGGFRVPFVVRWPEKVQAGTTCEAMVSLVDCYATISDLVGEPLPAPLQAAPDSFSFLPQLLGNADKVSRESMILHNVKGNFAIRKGPWKYIEGKAHPRADSAALRKNPEYHMQLYNLQEDPGETRNVLTEHPRVRRGLVELLQDARRQPHTR